MFGTSGMRVLLVGAALMMAVSGAWGAMVNSGVVNPTRLDGTTLADRPELAGSIIYDRLIPLSLSTWSGGTAHLWLEDRVIREDGTGTLDFSQRLYRDSNDDANDFVPMVSLRRLSFSGAALDLDYRNDGLGRLAPQSATYKNGVADVSFMIIVDNVIPAGPAMPNLVAISLMGPGDSTKFVFIRTSATQFNLGGKTVLDTGDQLAVAFGTAQPVPLPAAFWSGLIGLGIVGLVICRKPAGSMV